MLESQLHVKSTLGKGSTFWFDVELPVVEDSRISLEESPHRVILGYTKPADSQSTKSARYTILVADDHTDNRLVFKELLVSLGFDVLEAVDGIEVLEKVKIYHPDVVFMDLIMPEMDGYEATKRIRQIPELQDVIVIAFSAHVIDMKEPRHRTIRYDDVLMKPFTIDTLTEKLQKHLNLEWIYEEHDVGPAMPHGTEAEPVIPPPDTELQTLYELTRLGDIMAIRHWVKRAEELEPKFTPFVTRIALLAKTLQIKKMRKFVNQYIKETL
jgi:CheY-like chemotaxis protein